MQYKLFLNAAGIAAVAVALCVGCNGGNPSDDSKPTLSVSASPANGGSVSRDPSSSSYANGDEVTVTATAASGYVFTGWSGASTSTDASITVTMDGNKTLTAIFKRLYTLTTNTSPSSGGSVSRDPDKTSYADGEQVTLTAVDNDGYIFTAWGGASTSTDASITITMDSDKMLMASFQSLTVVPGESLADKLAWFKRSADNNNTYLIEVDADESIAPGNTLGFDGTTNITVVLRGVGENRIIKLKSNGIMFTVGLASGVSSNNSGPFTFILDNNITLQGHSGNTGSMVCVLRGGRFIMNNGTAIIGNSNTSRNTYVAGNLDGGGVFISGGSSFVMNGGTISGNTAVGGLFGGGGGVFISSGSFVMNDGTISNNVTNGDGGGVSLAFMGDDGCIFTMRGGTITGNTTNGYGGGGVHVGHYLNNFTKTGGTITGYSTSTNGNVVKDSGGNAVSRRGHAVYCNGSNVRGDYRRETTAGPEVNLSNSINANWDN